MNNELHPYRFLMKRSRTSSLLAATLCLSPLEVWAEFYKYKDSSGALVITYDEETGQLIRTME